MKAGIRLDVFIAVYVFGINNATYRCPKCGSEDVRNEFHTDQDTCNMCSFNLNYKGRHVIPKRYSTDIAAAWEVVEKFEKTVIEVHVWCSNSEVSMGWSCSIQDREWSEEYRDAGTAPQAICLAALKAVGYEFPRN